MRQRGLWMARPCWRTARTQVGRELDVARWYDIGDGHHGSGGGTVVACLAVNWRRRHGVLGEEEAEDVGRVHADGWR